jgi:hypothetical protein
VTGWKNENRIGEANPRARLANDQVAEMRRLRARQWTIADLAVMYGVPESVVLDAIRGKTYKAAGGPIEERGVKMPMRSSVMSASSPARLASASHS